MSGEIALRIAVQDARAGSAAARQEARRAEELAAVLQESLLPAILPAVPGVDLVARYRPAGQGVGVLGDFYDVFPTPDGWGVVVGDVCGKGATAAKATAMSRATVRAFGHDGRDPAEVLALLDEVLVTGEGGHARPVAAAYGPSTTAGQEGGAGSAAPASALATCTAPAGCSGAL